MPLMHSFSFLYLEILATKTSNASRCVVRSPSVWLPLSPCIRMHGEEKTCGIGESGPLRLLASANVLQASLLSLGATVP